MRSTGMTRYGFSNHRIKNNVLLTPPVNIQAGSFILAVSGIPPDSERPLPVTPKLVASSLLPSHIIAIQSIKHKISRSRKTFFPDLVNQFPHLENEKAENERLLRRKFKGK